MKKFSDIKLIFREKSLNNFFHVSINDTIDIFRVRDLKSVN